MTDNDIQRFIDKIYEFIQGGRYNNIVVPNKHLMASTIAYESVIGIFDSYLATKGYLYKHKVRTYDEGCQNKIDELANIGLKKAIQIIEDHIKDRKNI